MLIEQIIETTEVRRHNGECEYGAWRPLADASVPAHVREAVADCIAEAISRDMKGFDPRPNTDERGQIIVGGTHWVYRR